MTAASPWPSVRLDTVGNVVTGSTPPTNDRSNYGRQHLFASPADLGHTKYVRSTAKMLSAKGFAKSRLIPAGSTLFVCIGSTIGKIGLAGEDLTTNQQINSIVPKGAVDPEFLFYAASTLSALVREQAGEQAVPLVNKSQFSEFEISFPPLDEQRRISRALSDADDLTAALERLIAKKQAIKQGMTQQLLTGRTRLPGFSGNWASVALGDVADKRDRYSLVGGPFGSSLTSAEYTTTGVRILQLQNIGDGVFRDEYAIYTSERKADALRSSNIYPGDLLLAKMGDPVARACVVPGGPRRYQMASDGIRLAVDGSSFDSRLVMELINAGDFRSAAEAASTGSTRKRISLGQLRRLRMTLPTDLAEQTAIADALTSVDEQVSLLRDRLSKARAIKTGMMQQLLTGRVRLQAEATS